MSGRKILNSWKEISNYLSIEVRTAQRWEKKFGLPVYRIDESKRTYVFAYTDELDRWITEKTLKEKSKKSELFKLTLTIGIPVLLLISLIVFLLIFIPVWRDTTPADFRTTDTKLIIYNKHGKKLWGYDSELILDSTRYSKTTYSSSPSAETSSIFFKDIDKDNRLNIIFAVQTKYNADEHIICFNEQGNKLWQYCVGEEAKYGDQIISSDFDIGRLRVFDLNNDGFLETIMIASHKTYFPCRIIVLDHEGNLLGEYWNSGHLNCLEFLDLDDDGFKEILLGGLNNNYNQGCLVVLDPRRIEGSSPQIKGTRYYPEGKSPGTEKYYLLIPKNEVGNLLGLYDTIPAINIYSNNRFQINTHLSRVFYEFDYQLRAAYIHTGDEFDLKFDQLVKEGKINLPKDTVKNNISRTKFLYWDGKEWTSEPTMTSYWKNKLAARQ